jgi:hypothetical protein
MSADLIPFGKYKGQPLEAIQSDKQYIDWLLAWGWFKEKYEDADDRKEIETLVEKTCSDCANWTRDKVGDGLGIGECLLKVNPKQLKWPGILACEQFAAKKT